jgi:hypothetical protein
MRCTFTSQFKTMIMKILFLKSLVVIISSTLVSLIGFTASGYIHPHREQKQDSYKTKLLNKNYENINRRYTNPKKQPYIDIHWWGDPIQVDTTHGC